MGAPKNRLIIHTTVLLSLPHNHAWPRPVSSGRGTTLGLTPEPHTHTHTHTHSRTTPAGQLSAKQRRRQCVDGRTRARGGTHLAAD